MKSKIIVSSIVFGTIVCSEAVSETRKPNVIVILADDIGWGDLGCYGAKLINTPNLDALAKKGVLFRNGYASASTSTPTRYTMLTGEYAFRKGYQILPGDAPMIIQRDNLASMMKSKGYYTAVVGKWHLGLGIDSLDFNTKIAPSPNDIGFDYSFIIPATGDRVPCVYIENGYVVNHDVNKGDIPIEVSYNHKIGNEPTGLENPEMMKLMYYHPNHSMTIINGIPRMGWMTGGYRARWVDEEISDQLAIKAIQVIRDNKEKPFFLYLATHDAHEPRVANARFRGSSGCGIYGDVIQQFDDCVGMVVSALKKEGLFENTILIISSDNGPDVKQGYIDGALENLNDHDPFGGLRGQKASIYEGGLRVPYLFSWPSVVKKGRIEEKPVSLSNLIPTITSLVGKPLPEGTWKDAQDDSKIYLNKKGAVENPVYLQHGFGEAKSIRYQGWKYILHPNGTEELYHLSMDPSETTNAADSNIEKKNELKAKLLEFLGRNQEISLFL